MVSFFGKVKPTTSLREALPTQATCNGSPATTDFGTVNVTFGGAGWLRVSPPAARGGAGLGWGRGFLAGGAQGVTQLGRIARRVVFPAGRGGEAAEAALVLALDGEANDVGAELDTQLLEFGAQRAGIGAAGLDAVADQDYRGALLGVFQRLLGGLLHRCRQRRHALRRDALGDGRELRRIDLTGRRQHLDVGAVVLAAVAVGHQPDLDLGIPALEQLAQRLAGDLDARGGR